MVYRRIREFGWHSYRPHLVSLLTIQYLQQRLERCRLRLHWNVEWHRVVFRDESQFRCREYPNVDFFVTRRVLQTVGIMVWRTITYRSRSCLTLWQYEHPVIWGQGGRIPHSSISSTIGTQTFPAR